MIESSSDDDDESVGDDDEDEAEVSDMDEDDRPEPPSNQADIDVDDSDGDQEVEDEGEEDAEGDMDMYDDADDGLPLGAPPPALPVTPSLKIKGPAAPQQQPRVTVTPAQDAKLKSVEAKEMEMEDDDEELSELGSDDDEDEDAEGEDDVDEMEEGDESRSPEAGSRASTPDVSKMTKRQRSRFDQFMGGDFLQLPMGKYPASLSLKSSVFLTPFLLVSAIFKPEKIQRAILFLCSLQIPLSYTRNPKTSASSSQAFFSFVHGNNYAASKLLIILTRTKNPSEPQIKKHLTAEEHAMRRAEMARRRKNLSEKRNEEEKADTINRLLKKQAPKRRGKISQAEIQQQDRMDDEGAEGGGTAGKVGLAAMVVGGEAEEEEEVRKADPVFVRWVSSKEGCRIGVPEEWLGAPVGRVFAAGGGGEAMMVQEVEG